MDSQRSKRDSIGLSGLSSQVYRKVNKKGFDFTLMVAGESGLGKTTLINSLFLHEEKAEHTLAPAADRIQQTINIEPKTTHLTEKGVQLKLTTVDTPGFSDAVDNDGCWQPIVDYIDRAFETYLRDESKVDRTKIQDDRVHCLLYFLAPHGHGMKPVDIAALKALHDKVNIVPVIAKADTFTRSELAAFKKQIRDELGENDIRVFQPAMDDEDDEETTAINKKIRDNIPFAVVGSDTVFEVAGRSVRGRQYPWGVVEVDNPAHCDFGLLRDMIVRTHLQELKDVTSEVLYENYRTQALVRNPALMERSMAPSSPATARESVSAASGSEAEQMEKMKQMLEEQARQLEAQRRQFEQERLKYESMRNQQMDVQGDTF